MYMPRRRAGVLCGWMLLGATTLVTGCASDSHKAAAVYQNEHFQSDETYSRMFDGDPKTTCEAARRTLLSQGYVISSAKDDHVAGSKGFQPDGDMHVEISFNVVCTADGQDANISTAFVSATQDRFALKKNSNSASVGVSVLGTVSIPLPSTDDSMVKVGSETIPAGKFYDRFFALMQRFLLEQKCGDPEGQGCVK